MINNLIAKDLNDEMVKDIFGKKEAPLSLLKACDAAKTEIKALTSTVCELKRKIKILEEGEEKAHQEVVFLNAEIYKLNKQNKTLQSKLTVSNRKCSAYKSILKDAITKE